MSSRICQDDSLGLCSGPLMLLQSPQCLGTSLAIDTHCIHMKTHTGRMMCPQGLASTKLGVLGSL